MHIVWKLLGYVTCHHDCRERPRLVFPPGGARPSHLVTSACSAPACPGPGSPPGGCVDCKYNHHDYTLVTPLGPV